MFRLVLIIFYRVSSYFMDLFWLIDTFIAKGELRLGTLIVMRSLQYL